MKRLVIRSLGGMGEVLMMTPALRDLKIAHPEDELFVAIPETLMCVLKGLPYIDGILDSRTVVRRHFDWVRDVSYTCIRWEGLHPNKNRIDLYRDIIVFNRERDPSIFTHDLSDLDARPSIEAGIPTGNCPDYLILAEDSTSIKSYIRPGGVFLHISSTDIQRNWPVTKYRQLIAATPHIQYVVSDHIDRDWSQPNVLDCSSMGIRETAAVLNQCKQFVGPDSGWMHMAAALGIPSICLFGATPPEARINYYPTHIALQAPNCECLGCWYKACPNQIKCMSGISVARVQELLQA